MNDSLYPMDFTDIYRILHPNTNEYTFFSSAHGTFSRIDHIFSIHSSVEEHHGSFHSLAIVDIAAVNIGVQVSRCFIASVSLG